MENNGHDKITAFDSLFTTNHIQMLKILMPYFEPSMRKQLVVYIKYLELRYALSYFDSHPHDLYGCSGKYGGRNSPDGIDPFGKEEFNIGKICSELIPYCTSDEKQKIEQISGLFRSMEMYKEMSQAMETMKEFMPDMPADFLSNFMQNPAFNTNSGFPSNISDSSPGHIPAAVETDGSQAQAMAAVENSHSTWGNTEAVGRPAQTQGSATDSEKQHNPQGGNASAEAGNQNSPGKQTNGNNIMDMLMNMLSPEQKAMFEMFGGNQTHESE